MKTHSRNAFTLVELLIVMAIIGILVALTAGAVFTARGDANTADCLSRMRDVGMNIKMAVERNVDFKPKAADWATKLVTYNEEGLVEDEAEAFRCPSDVRYVGNSDAIIANPSYGLNPRYLRMQSGDSDKIVLLDYLKPNADVVGQNPTDFTPNADPTQVVPWDQFTPTTWHDGKVNTLRFGGNGVTMDSFDLINPADCEIHYDLWQPTRDHKYERADCL